MKFIYLLATVLFLSSCSKSDNTSYPVFSGKIDGHEYIQFKDMITHSGNCAKCKHELDSIVKNAVNEAIEANNTENWNKW